MTKAERLPVVFIPHGGGPWPFVDLGLDRREVEDLAGYLRGLPASLPTAPRALLVISAHWEADRPTVMSGEAPPLLFDYYGFPAESYALTWPAPGAPWLAARTRSLLEDAGFPTGEDRSRGYDHGTFIPLKLAWPGAEVPVVQLSLLESLDPAAHLAMGRALAPLREEGVLIVGSGMSYHNLRAFWGSPGIREADAFDAWLGQAATAPRPERERSLAAWAEQAPSARQVHPREEHLLPLMVVAGAAGEDAGRVPWRGTMAGKRISAVQYG